MKKNTTHLNLKDAAKAVLRGKVTAVNNLFKKISNQQSKLTPTGTRKKYEPTTSNANNRRMWLIYISER